MRDAPAVPLLLWVPPSSNGNSLTVRYSPYPGLWSLQVGARLACCLQVQVVAWSRALPFYLYTRAGCRLLHVCSIRSAVPALVRTAASVG